jgi:hypothetical protein
MHSASTAAILIGVVGATGAVIGLAAILTAAIGVQLRLRRYRRCAFGIDDAIVHDELTAHLHMTTVDPPAVKTPPWWRRLG